MAETKKMTNADKLSKAYSLLSEAMDLLDGTDNVHEDTFCALISVREEVGDLTNGT